MSPRGVWRKLKALWLRRRAEAELDDELASHLELQARKYMTGGATEAEARRRARLDFGGLESAREECREADGWSALDALSRNLKFAFRSLRRSPGFAVVAIVILAMGMGANLAVFNLVNALLLRPLAFAERARIGSNFVYQ